MVTNTLPLELVGRRVSLKPLAEKDYAQWKDLRTRCRDWLVSWEPRPLGGQRGVVEDQRAFAARCGSRERERQLGSGYGFGIFVGDRLAGEINLSSIQRGPFQNCYVGYWIDQALAGNGYVPEAVVVLLRFAFEELGLHRVQISIIPRNSSSRRVAEKLGLRDEGLAVRYLEIDGKWEDHIRFAITAEEWADRRDVLMSTWVR